MCIYLIFSFKIHLIGSFNNSFFTCIFSSADCVTVMMTFTWYMCYYIITCILRVITLLRVCMLLLYYYYTRMWRNFVRITSFGNICLIIAVGYIWERIIVFYCRRFQDSILCMLGFRYAILCCAAWNRLQHSSSSVVRVHLLWSWNFNLGGSFYVVLSFFCFHLFECIVRFIRYLYIYVLNSSVNLWIMGP